MSDERKEAYGHNVVANGRNWNVIKLLTGVGATRKGHRLVSISIHFKTDEVLVISKKEGPKGPEVSFLAAPNIDAALYVLASSIKSKQMGWRPDKWRTTRNDKN